MRTQNTEKIKQANSKRNNLSQKNKITQIDPYEKIIQIQRKTMKINTERNEHKS